MQFRLVTVRTGTFSHYSIMRSVPKGSFERLTAPEALWQGYLASRRQKRRRANMAAFELNADRAIVRMSRELRGGTYRPKSYTTKVIYDPKKRLICTPCIEDRIIHQAMILELGPTFERGFHLRHYACSTGRGPHRAVMYALGCNRKYAFRVHLDIRRYFLSIHRPTLLELFTRRLRDRQTVELIRRHLEQGGEVYETPMAKRALNLNECPRPTPQSGLAIGAYLSQWSGALYLDGLDHFVSRTLKIRGYLRYMDDLLLFAQTPTELVEAIARVDAWLSTNRLLLLNPRRNQIESTVRPFTYLGYRITRGGIEASKKLSRRLSANLKKANKKGPEEVERCLASYRGLLGFG